MTLICGDRVCWNVLNSSLIQHMVVIQYVTRTPLDSELIPSLGFHHQNITHAKIVAIFCACVCSGVYIEAEDQPLMLFKEPSILTFPPRLNLSFSHVYVCGCVHVSAMPAETRGG